MVLMYAASEPFMSLSLKTKLVWTRMRDYVMESEEVMDLKSGCMMVDLCPLYRNEGKSQLVIAIGCTGHRSVVLAEALSQHIYQLGYRAMVNHRYRQVVIRDNPYAFEAGGIRGFANQYY